LEYLALATGYRSLLIVCAALYLGAYLLTPRPAGVPGLAAAVGQASR
jgi:hypothetical protein